MTWTPSSAEDVASIEVWGYDTDGFYVGKAVTTWSSEVAHEEVVFENDSDVIRSSEVPKLEAPLVKIKDMVSKDPNAAKATFYVQGHTDTKGTDEHNVGLSRRRARAIAAWFRDHGLKNPIAYEGIGKLGLLVKTGDQVDEPRNRRVRYFFATTPQPLPPGEFSWKSL
jgi:outer membrane protein OmpA-like peptidoglycan-associated protein